MQLIHAAWGMIMSWNFIRPLYNSRIYKKQPGILKYHYFIWRYKCITSHCMIHGIGCIASNFKSQLDFHFSHFSAHGYVWMICWKIFHAIKLDFCSIHHLRPSTIVCNDEWAKILWILFFPFSSSKHSLDTLSASVRKSNERIVSSALSHLASLSLTLFQLK